MTDENRKFNAEWEVDYFVIETVDHCMICLICEQVLKTLKVDNARQHYRRHESHAYAKMDSESRKNCVENLKKKLKQRKTTFQTFLNRTNVRVEASYKVAHILGAAGKSYSDGELVKKCLVEAVKCIHPDEEIDFAAIPLSRDTIQRRQCTIAKQLKQSLMTKVSSSKTLFSLAVDESNDICDSAQLLIFIRSLSPEFEIHEDFLSMESLHGNTQGEDIFEAVKKSCLDSDLNMTCLRGICTDGAPVMLGRKQGFVARLTEYVIEEYNNKHVTSLHCIIHQEALCAKAIDFSETMNQVKQIIIYIRSNALRHRQFRTILYDSEVSFEDVLYHVPVRWLSQGETACRVLNLRREISTFYATKKKQCPLDDSNFLVALAFLVDVLSYINGLNQCLQGKNLNVCQMYRKVQDFTDKCRLLQRHIMQKQYFHFSQLSALIEQQGIDQNNIPTTTFAAVFDSILKQFDDRFGEFHGIKKQLQLVSAPHTVEIESAPLEFQMELLELKNDDLLKNKFNECTDLVEVWKSAVAYPNLRELARNILVLFGSTYVCEAAFSKMKYLKSKYRSRLTDCNLESCLRLMLSTLPVDFKKLTMSTQDHGSH